MKSKVHFPFISFFIEPNIVCVYKMKKGTYVNESEILNHEESMLFEVNSSDDFENFHHEEHKASSIEGRSFWLSQEAINEMVAIINQHMQKHRDGHQGETRAVHIVSSEAAAGFVRRALAPPKHVIGFPDDLSIGPLWKLDEKIGQTNRNEWLADQINDEQDDYVYAHKFSNTLREIEDLPHQVPIHIWYGNSANEQVGLRFFLYLLRDRTNVIFLINTNEVSSSKNEVLESEDVNLLCNNGSKPITDQERPIFLKEWETLSETKEVLRLWENGKIIGVPEDYYDSLIIQTIKKLHHDQLTKDYIQTGTVLMELVTQMDEQVNIFFLEYRIRHLVYSGVLAIKGIPKSMSHYRIKLRD